MLLGPLGLLLGWGVGMLGGSIVDQSRVDAQAAADAARKSRNEKRKSDFDDHIHHLFGRKGGADKPVG